jgi:hypothetical protein
MAAALGCRTRFGCIAWADPAGFAQTEQIVDALAHGERALTAPYRTAVLVWRYIAKSLLQRDNAGA